jgi:CubicO group peptidase (beta-lactamase class C family)
MRKGLTSIFTAFSALLAVPSASASSLSAEKAAAIDRIVQRGLAGPGEVRPAKSTAISISLGVNGKLVHAKGYGVAAPQFPAVRGTRYLVGSITKQFTAAAVLKAIEEGAVISGTSLPLTLDTPMSAVFKGLGHWDTANERPMTVRRLLTMTSNLPNFTVRPPSGLDPWGAAPAQHLLGEFKKLTPADGWSRSFRYSNTSYFMLAELLDRVTTSDGQSIGSYVMRVQRLFDAADMRSSGFVGELKSPREVATPSYRRRPAFLKPDWLKGSGDMVSNAIDLFRWNVALMDGKVINRESLRLMFAESARVTPRKWYGMGWFIEQRTDRTIYSHSGFVPGFTTLNAIVRPTGTSDWASIVILTNADEADDLERIADDIVHVLLFER